MLPCFFIHMIYLSLGTNLGDKTANLKLAVELLGSIGTVKSVSSYWCSDPWGFKSDNGFINIAVAMESDYDPLCFLNRTKQIEKEMGRTKKSLNGYCDRIIDIDIIDFNGKTINTDELTLPHPHVGERKFVLFPLYEIAPDWHHAKYGLGIKEMIDNCKDTGNCIKHVASTEQQIILQKTIKLYS